jgi:hypothetical protein
MYCFLVSCFLVSGHRLDAVFFNNFQDLEARDFEQEQGEEESFIYRASILLYFTFVYMRLN